MKVWAKTLFEMNVKGIRKWLGSIPSPFGSTHYSYHTPPTRNAGSQNG